MRLWLFFVVLAVAPLVAQPFESFPPDIFDTRPTGLDPVHFTLIFENDRVQVIKVRLGPREKSTIMEIPGHVMTCLTDQRVRIRFAHAKPADRQQ